jgi:hypothetical protein
MTAVVLVEGESDRLALEALAARLGRDLAADGVAIVPIGGATNIRRFLAEYGPAGRNLRLAGLCDAHEEESVRRSMEGARLGNGLTRAGMESLGFYVCERDLEDELIRALGVPAVERVIAEQGELASFRTLQHQPAQRAATTEQQLHRFMGTRSGRKARYARALVDALDLTRVPRPLAGVLAHV